MLRADSIVTFEIPQGTFLHTDPSASVTLEARMSDGSSLPSWLQFNPERGMFVGEAPPGTNATYEIEVIARDSNGAEAAARFSLMVTDDETVATELLQEVDTLPAQIPAEGEPQTTEETPPQGDGGAPPQAGNSSDNRSHAGLQEQLIASRPTTLQERALALIEALLGRSQAEPVKPGSTPEIAMAEQPDDKAA